AGHHELAARDGACPANRQVGRRVGQIHPIHILEQPKPWVRPNESPHSIEILLARLPDDSNLVVAEQIVDVLDHGLVYRAASERSPEHGDHELAGFEVEMSTGPGRIGLEQFSPGWIAAQNR